MSASLPASGPVCPDCAEIIEDLESNIQIGEKVLCPNCWAALEVVSLGPTRLDFEADEFEADDELWNEENG